MNQKRKLKKGLITREEIKLGKKSKLEKLSEKILTSFSSKDSDGKIYVNFCSYSRHPGIIGDVVYEQRKCYQCFHYRKLKEE